MWWAAPIAIVALLAAGVGTVALYGSFIEAARAFAEPYPMSYVGGRDELYKLGPASGFLNAVLGIILPLVPLVTLALLIPYRTHRWAWTIPLIGVFVVALGVVIGIGLFEPPPPDGG